MSRCWPLLERGAVHGLLLLCGLCCLGIAWSTADLERANARRREQLQLLGALVADPTRLPPGPIAALDGLYARRLARIATQFGPAIAFVDGGGREAVR